MTASFLIRIISTEDTFKVRNEVLRPGRPISECFFTGDNSEGTFHLGIFNDNKIIGVASFMKNSNPFFDLKNQYQLRGMAVLSQYKGQGVGTLLLKEGELKIKIKNSEPFLWFNARVTAIDFYKKHEYQTIGKKFEVPGVCEHIVMYKNLSNKNPELHELNRTL